MQEILRKLVTRDVDAFEQIVKLYEKQLLVIASSKLKDSSMACDVVQETFISLYLNANKIKDSSKLKSWLAIVLLNNCNKLNRKNEMAELSFEEEELDKKISTSNEEFEKIFDEMDFLNTINFLNEEERTIIAMYYSEDYSAKDIASILNIKLGTIKSKISRAKEKIKNKFKGDKNGNRE